MLVSKETKGTLVSKGSRERTPAHKGIKVSRELVHKEQGTKDLRVGRALVRKVIKDLKEI